MSEEQVIEMLTYGKGPLVQVADLRFKPDGTPRLAPQGDILYKSTPNGRVCNINSVVIRLDVNITIPFLEKAETRSDYLAGKFLIESVIYHESTHYGNALIHQNINGCYTESGKAFEISVYGEDVNYGNYKRIYNSSSSINVLPKIKTQLIFKPIITYGQIH